MANLSLQHIDKIYDNNVQAVFDFNLEVKDGEFIVLVGHWAEPILDELSELVEKEFSLPYFEFVYDER